VRLGRGGALSGGGRPRSGTAEQPRRGESGAQAAWWWGLRQARVGATGMREVKRRGDGHAQRLQRGRGGGFARGRDVGSGASTCVQGGETVARASVRSR
jgi:hypothetical protein